MSAELKNSKTQVQRKEEAIRKILDAAVDLIVVRGVKDLTMAEIGVHAGYSRGLPHQHFGSKENLIEAVLHAIIGRFNQRLRGQQPPAPGMESIKSLVSTYLERDAEGWKASKAFIILMADASLISTRHKTLIQKHNQKNIEFILKHLEIEKTQRHIKFKIQEKDIATIIMGTMRGLALHALNEEEVDFSLTAQSLNYLLDDLMVK